MSNSLPISECSIARTSMMSQLGILMQTGLEMLMIEKFLRRFFFFFVGNNLVSWMSKKHNSILLSTTEAEYIAALLPVAIAPSSYGCKNSSLIMVFIKNILPSIVTILVPLTSLKILFNILEQNIQRFDTTSFESLSKMAHSLLTSSTLMIKRMICSPSLLITNGLNSYAKTLE